MSTFDFFPDSGAIRFQRVRDFGEIVRAGVLFVRSTFREFATGMLVVAGPVLLVSTIAQLLFQRDLFSQGALVGPEALIGSGSMLSAQLFGLVAIIVALAASFGYVRLYRQGEAGRITPGVLWEETKQLLLPALGTTVLIFLGFVLLVSVVAGLAAALAAVAAPLAVLAALGALALLLWLLPAYLIVYPARFLGADSAFDAIAVALRFLRARWSRAFGVAFVLVVLFVVLSTVLSIPVLVVGGTAALVGPGEPPGALLAAFTLIGTLLNLVVVYPVLAAVSSLLFSSIAEEQSGRGLIDDLEAFAAGGQRDAAAGATPAPGLRHATAESAPSYEPAGAETAAQAASDPGADPLTDPLTDPPADPAPAAPPPENPAPEERPGGGFRGGGFGA